MRCISTIALLLKSGVYCGTSVCCGSNHAVDTTITAWNFLQKNVSSDRRSRIPASGEGRTVLLPNAELTSLRRATVPQGKNPHLSSKSTQKPQAGIPITSKELLPILSCLAPLIVLAVAIFEFFHLQWSGVDFQKPLEVPHSKQSTKVSLSQILHGMWPISRIYWYPADGKDAAPGHGKLIGVSCLLLGAGQILVDLCLSFWSQEFWDVMARKEFERFVPLLVRFSMLAALFIIMDVYMSYLRSMLEIRWRQHLTENLQRTWLAHAVFYQMQIQQGDDVLDNPDQRIQEDAGLFVSSCITVVGGFLMAIGYFVVFLPLLLYLSPMKAFGIIWMPGWLALLLLCYSLIGSVASHFIGQKLIGINFARQSFEANFRYSMVQIKDNAESIALYGSEDCESSALVAHFQSIKRIFWESMHYTKLLGFFQSFYSESSVIIPLFLLAPNYFQNQITFGTMMSINRTASNLKVATDWVINAYADLAEFRATTDRISTFLLHMEQQHAEACTVQRRDTLPGNPTENAAVVVRDLCVELPPPRLAALGVAAQAGPDSLWHNAELIVKPGTFVLLTAPEGTGKTCFFRAIAGIWPYSTGETFFSSDPVFVPQKSYIPSGTLKQAIAYPQSEETYSDIDVRKALVAVGLESLRVKGMQEVADWSLILSGGEQQRLAMARIILRRPSCVFFDEATSAVGAEGTMALYRLLRSEKALPTNVCIVTVSHQVDLLKPLHDVHYAHQGGCWVRVEEN